MLMEIGNKLALEEITHAAASATNDVATITIAAPAATARHIATKITWSLSDDPSTAVALTITGDNAAFSVDITKGGPGALTLPPYVCNRGTALVASLAAADSGIVGKINLSYYTAKFE